MSQSIVASEWNTDAYGGNRRGSPPVQRDCGGVAPVRPMLELPDDMVSRVSFSGSLNACLRHDGRDDQELAADISVSQGYFSKLVRGVWEQQTKRLIRFMRATGCIAPLQFIANEMGCDVVVRAPALSEADRLRRENEELRRALSRRAA